jgi:hypothetical protein
MKEFTFEFKSFSTDGVEVKGEGAVIVTCKKCGEEVEIPANWDEVNAWATGNQLIQHALPKLTVAEREILISGICGVCFDKMFRPEPPEDEQARDSDAGFPR